MSIIWPGTSFNGKTCAVVNGSPTVVITGNLAADLGSPDPGAAGMGFLGPDDRTYGVASTLSYDAGADATAITLSRNYAGSTVGSGGRFDILPFNGLSGAAAYQLARLLARSITPTRVVLNVADAPYYAVCDDGSSTADNTSAVQGAIDAAAALGGDVYIPGGICKVTNLLLPGAVGLRGTAKYGTILRGTAGGKVIAAAGSGNNTVSISDLTIDVTQDDAICLDVSRFISSSFRSLRFRTWGGVNQIGDHANITDEDWTSFFNVFVDIAYDAIATGSFRASSVDQSPTRHRFIAPTFRNCFNCFDWDNVQGAAIVGAEAADITGKMFLIGAACDRVHASLATMEAAAATMFDINVAANRFACYGWEVHAGAWGITTSIGLNGLLVNPDGTYFSTATSPFPRLKPKSAQVGVTYGPTINADAFTGRTFVVTVTNGTGFTVAAPSNPQKDQRITYLIRNASGGAVGAITWNAVFKMGTFTAPADGFSRSITFEYDGTNYIELFTSFHDVPN